MIHPDASVLRDVPPSRVEDTLRASGWELTGERPGVRVWTAPESRAEVVIPTDQSLDDYPQLLARSLRDIRDLIGPDAVRTTDMLLSSHPPDVVAIRIDARTGVDGSLPLDVASRALASIRSILVASAAATEERKSFYGRSKSRRASGIANSIRLGQTFEGSFGIRLISRELQEPAAVDAALPGVPSSALSFERRTLETMARALNSARTGATELAARQDFTAMSMAVRDGVSADLCNSLAEMSSTEGVDEIEFRFDWSIATEAPRIAERPVAFMPSDAPVLRQAAQRLEPERDRMNFGLEGQVIGLRRQPDETERAVATVEAVVGGTRRKVRVPVDGADHDLAVASYESGEELRMTGDLILDGRTYFLLNISNAEPRLTD